MRGITVKRKFDGKLYEYRTLTGNKRQANDVARYIRAGGRLARVIRSGSSYLVYSRRKT